MKCSLHAQWVTLIKRHTVAGDGSTAAIHAGWAAATFERNGSVPPPPHITQEPDNVREITHPFCLRHAYDAHANENMRDFVEHAACAQFKWRHTLTPSFYESLRYVKYVSMADVALPDEGMKVLEPPARCLAPNGSRGRRVPIHEAVRTGKFRKGGARRLTREGAVVSEELRDITSHFIDNGSC